MRVVGPALAALAAIALVASTSSAQMNGMPGNMHPRMIHVGIGGGLSVPTSDAKDVLKNGWNGQAWVSVAPPMLPVSFRAAFDMQKSDIKTTSSVPASQPALTGGTNQVLAGLANVRVNLLRGSFEPYVTAGLGGYNVKTDPNDATLGSNSTTRFGINGGAGLCVQVRQIQLYVEGRVDNVYTERGVIDAKTIQLVPVTFGISY